MAHKKAKNKTPRCKTCGKLIRSPKEWGAGARVRRHYWREHPEVMRGDR
jgi:hypothetical protein